MITEEKDLNKLKLKSLRNALALPLNQSQSCLGVLQVYNYSEELFNEELLSNLSNLMSGLLQSVETLQEHFINTDIVDAHFNLIQDAVIVLTVSQTVSKLNRPAIQMLGLRTTEQVLGKHVAEVISPSNGHLFNIYKEMIESKAP